MNATTSVANPGAKVVFFERVATVPPLPANAPTGATPRQFQTSPLFEFDGQGAIQARIDLLVGGDLVSAQCARTLADPQTDSEGSPPCFIALRPRTEVLRARSLAPSLGETAIRVWPISIQTLGRFEIRSNDQPSGREGKAQRKPMALLKALIALGASDVPIAKLISIVWADAPDGDGQTCFDVTLHRLRKLLGHQTAIQVADRRVSLNRQLVWVDLWELERELGTAIPLGQARVPTAETLEHAAPAILDLYRGHFLPGEADTPWLLPVRNRLNGRFHRFVMRLGDHWEAAAEWSRAAELFERAIELEPLAEVFYFRLMVCLREQGHRTEALDVFRRFRQILSVTLGVKPAQATEAVYHELLAS